MKLKRALAALMLLAGALLLLGQPLWKWWNQSRQAETIAQYTRSLPAPAAEPERDVEADDRLLEDIRAYNREIFASGQASLSDPFAVEQPVFRLADYGFEGEVFGVVWIPRMNARLPLYLGADKENLALGCALLGGTSIPCGEPDTNAIIAGHRGYNGVPMLRDIQQLQIGDRVEITTPWETLVYRVSALSIIQPDNVEAIRIQPGRELVTLFTCHPYPGNTHRYLVEAERDRQALPLTPEEGLAEAADSYDAAPRPVTVVAADGSAEVEELSPAGDRDTARYMQAEVWLNRAGIGLLAIVALGFAALAVRRRKKEN